jgi:hypothetical protein
VHAPVLEYRLRVWITEAATTAEFHFQNFASALVSAAPAMNPPNFFALLKRPNVYKVAYAGLAWLLIQIATQVFRFFEIPNWSVRLDPMFDLRYDPRFWKLIADGEMAIKAPAKP